MNGTGRQEKTRGCAVDRKALVESGIIHERDFESDLDRLRGFYGLVSRKQNDLILRNVAGTRVLDVGAGYGNLASQLREAGKDVTAIEIDEEKVLRAREWFGVEMLQGDFLDWDFREGSFDTVVFREVANHLNLEEAFARAFSLARRRCLVFQGTENLPLRLAKKWYGHREYRQSTPEALLAAIGKAGFVNGKTIYTDVLAFPLSGGYLGRCWVPRWKPCHSVVMALDEALCRAVNLVGAGRQLCFRMLIVAEKPG